MKVNNKQAGNGLTIIGMIIAILGGVSLLKQASRKYEQDKALYHYKNKIDMFQGIRQRAYDNFEKEKIPYDVYDRLDNQYDDSVRVYLDKIDSLTNVE